MKHSHTAGFGAIAIIAVISLIALGSGYVYISSNQPVTHETNTMGESDGDKKIAEESAEMNENGEGGDKKDDENVETVLPTTLPKTKTAVDVDLDINPDLLSEVIDIPPLPVAMPGSWDDYAPEKLSMAENGSVVLFFHAAWCPSCRGLENDINANLSAIPDGVHLLKVDYDSETALKKKYGIVRQHTLVQVDENGNEIKTLTGLTNTLNQVLNQL